MENKDKNSRGFGRRISGFFGGRGFYIALFMCVALVGVYAWALLFEGGQEPGGYQPVSAEDDAQQAAVPVGSFGTSLILTGENAAAEANLPDDAHSEGRPASAGFDGEESLPVSAVEASVPDYFVWPVSGEILREHSVEALSYDVTMGDWRLHTGLDIAAQMGSKVYAVADGTVESIRHDHMLGTVVTIAHSGGMRSVYANLGSTPTVSEGDLVTAGTVIGSVSDSALGEIAEASHLHFAMLQDGENIDPTAYLPSK